MEYVTEVRQVDDFMCFSQSIFENEYDYFSENESITHTTPKSKHTSHVSNKKIKLDTAEDEKLAQKQINEDITNINKIEVNHSKSNSQNFDIVSVLKSNLINNSKDNTRNRANFNAVEDGLLSVAMAKAVEKVKTSAIFYGLPLRVKELYNKYLGIKELYEWQDECLKLPALNLGENLIYTLPTSGGKTLVAEILIMKELLVKKKNALLILPFVSIVQEKVRSLSQFAVDLNFHIEEYAGYRGAMPPRKRRGQKRTIFIATIEKAHSLINSLIETQRLSEIGLIVIDELHMLGDGSHRGAALETLICKVKIVDSTIQFIGMSATLGKMDILQKFLNASIYAADFRPVKLEEYIKIDNMILRYENGDLTPVEQLNYKPDPASRRVDPDNICNLVKEVIPEHSCLIFCPTKKHCENLAQLLAKNLPKDLKKVHKDGKKILLQRLITEVGSTCVILQHAILYGVAYHHSGLATEERRLLEEAYLEGTLCVLACTSTLAAGVNLPARRVILRAPYVGRDFISLSTYKQMVGRAGRAGLNSIGESYLIVQKEDKDRVLEMLSSSLELNHSGLSLNDKASLKMLVLSLIALGIATTEERVESALQQTMFAILEGHIVTKEQTQATLDYLKSNNYVYEKLDPEQGASLHVSSFGKAVVKGHMDVSQAKDIYEEVQQNLRSLNLQSHLHLLFLLTPSDNPEIAVVPNIYFKEYMTLSPEDQKVAEAIGVSEMSVVGVMMGHKPQNSAVVRFYQTLILYALWREEPIPSVAARFQLHRGTVQSLLSTATTYGSSLGNFCQAIDSLWAYQCLLPDFVRRLSSCAAIELLPLLDLPSVQKARARQLFNAGYKTLNDIANATPTTLMRDVEYLSHKVASQIIAAAKMLIFEKAEALQEEMSALIYGLDGTKL